MCIKNKNYCFFEILKYKDINMAIVSLDIITGSIPSNKTIVSVDYIISTDGTFSGSDKVVEILKDTVNKNGREFDLDFDSNDIYYGRVVLNFNTSGSDNYVNKTILLTRDGDGFSHNNSVVVTPKLTITSDIRNSELGGFTVDSSEFMLFLGIGSHKMTSWFIRNTNNEIIWSRKNDEFNKTKIRIPNDILKVNKHYIIEAVYIATGNQRSNAGRLLIKTMGKSRMSDIITSGDKRVSSDDYIELKNSYEDLLTIMVSNLALGATLDGS